MLKVNAYVMFIKQWNVKKFKLKNNITEQFVFYKISLFHTLWCFPLNISSNNFYIHKNNASK